MNFHIPHTRRSNYEAAYDAIKSAIKYQMGWSVSDRRIESLTYVSNRKKLTARVGEIGKIEHQFEVSAILEGPLYIVATTTKDGAPGPTILVDTKDVLEIQDFKLKDKEPTSSLMVASSTPKRESV
jgi:hypothetical protein